MKEIKKSVELLNEYRDYDSYLVDSLLTKEFVNNQCKLVVLDDDPTGVQTVHDVMVYTDWSMESIRMGFEESNKLFFILTNSRGFTVEQTTMAHIEIAERVAAVASEKNMEYLIISRSDSTLRGHYPLETQILRQVIRKEKSEDIDGEILCPYFKEGGRYTIQNIHYVKYGKELIPAADTEFAKDETFGYRTSDLCEYVEEKTGGEFTKENCICISLEMLRNMELDSIENKLLLAEHFHKIIVNAIDDYDVKVFCIALYRAMLKGKHFIIRCAAAMVKAIGNVSDKTLLSKQEMLVKDSRTGGIIVVGSHTKKTTAQLEELKQVPGIVFVEMNSDLVLNQNKLEKEVEKLLLEEEKMLGNGQSVCIFTKRELLILEDDTPEKALLRSVKISDALQQCVGKLNLTPAFVVAKGGITSSDVGVKALMVKKAMVLGQIQPGIPVWKIGAESRFPGIPFVIFPGNVGAVDTLKKTVQVLLSDSYK